MRARVSSETVAGTFARWEEKAAFQESSKQAEQACSS